MAGETREDRAARAERMGVTKSSAIASGSFCKTKKSASGRVLGRGEDQPSTRTSNCTGEGVAVGGSNGMLGSAASEVEDMAPDELRRRRLAKLDTAKRISLVSERGAAAKIEARRRAALVTTRTGYQPKFRTGGKLGRGPVRDDLAGGNRGRVSGARSGRDASVVESCDTPPVATGGGDTAPESKGV
jgi:hypothetical protein